MEHKAFLFSYELQVLGSFPGFLPRKCYCKAVHLEAGSIIFAELLKSWGLAHWPAQGAAWKLLLIAEKKTMGLINSINAPFQAHTHMHLEAGCIIFAELLKSWGLDPIRSLRELPESCSS